jgi:hypothetical protein
MLFTEEAYGWGPQEIPSSLEVLNQAFFYNVTKSSTVLITALWVAATSSVRDESRFRYSRT